MYCIVNHDSYSAFAYMSISKFELYKHFSADRAALVELNHSGQSQRTTVQLCVFLLFWPNKSCWNETEWETLGLREGANALLKCTQAIMSQSLAPLTTPNSNVTILTLHGVHFYITAARLEVKPLELSKKQD